MRKLILLTMMFVMFASVTVNAQEVSANVGWTSQYFYRGIFQATSSASAGVDVDAGPLSVSTWVADVGDGAEVDFFGTLSRENRLGNYVSVGGGAYLYTGGFDDTYLEATLGAGYGPLSGEFSFGQYSNFGAGKQNYWFAGVTAERNGFFGTVGGFGRDFTGNYGQVGYGFSAAELDWTISGSVNDKDLSGAVDGAGNPTNGTAIVLSLGKSFDL
jgi:hypothetical protein